MASRGRSSGPTTLILSFLYRRGKLSIIWYMIFSIAEIKPVKIQQILSVLKPDWNCYSSHRILDSFPRILKWKIVRLKPVLLAPRGRSINVYLIEKQRIGQILHIRGNSELSLETKIQLFQGSFHLSGQRVHSLTFLNKKQLIVPNINAVIQYKWLMRGHYTF